MNRWIKITDNPATWPRVGEVYFFTIKRWYTCWMPGKVWLDKVDVVGGKDAIYLHNSVNMLNPRMPTHYKIAYTRGTISGMY
ncbi:hypothetical protein [Microcystis phage Mel-JY01]